MRDNHCRKRESRRRTKTAPRKNSSPHEPHPTMRIRLVGCLIGGGVKRAYIPTMDVCVAAFCVQTRRVGIDAMPNRREGRMSFYGRTHSIPSPDTDKYSTCSFFSIYLHMRTYRVRGARCGVDVVGHSPRPRRVAEVIGMGREGAAFSCFCNIMYVYHAR